MNYINKNFKYAEENIAFDEFLLKEAQEGKIANVCRVWEAKDYVVVLGRGSNSDDDIFIDRCKNDNVKIIQRLSGGGSVLLGKGCLNYSLILSYNLSKELLNINNTYNFVLGSIKAAFLKNGISLTHFPPSDLALGNKKVSGNAQARRRNCLLFHGTFLYDFNIEKISLYLKEPKKTPPYRGSRTHSDFLTNLPIPASEINRVIKSCFVLN